MMNKRIFSKRVIGAWAVAFLLPLSFYIAAKVLKKDQLNLPGYYKIEKIQDGDTIYHQVRNIHLRNQFGESFDLEDALADKILVINFFFTDCPSICPKMTRNMLLLQKAFNKPKKQFIPRHEIQIISISVNPEADSVSKLRNYADAFGVNNDFWYFSAGDKADVAAFARQELGLLAEANHQDANALMHSETIVVLDKERFIRGYYNSSDSLEMKRCAEDIILLTMEKKKTR